MWSLVAYCDEVNFREESWANRDERVYGPLMEPVNVGAVDNGRELSAADPQSGADRGEAQHDLQTSGCYKLIKPVYER